MLSAAISSVSPLYPALSMPSTFPIFNIAPDRGKEKPWGAEQIRAYSRRWAVRAKDGGGGTVGPSSLGKRDEELQGLLRSQKSRTSDQLS